MPITNEERQSIINEAVEKTLLTIPEVIGNLIASHAAKLRMNKKFYSDHPELKDHKEAVASVIEQISNEDPSLDIEEIFSNALPKIKDRIKAIKPLDTKRADSPNGEF